jgi:hypothetical protein
MCTVSLIAPTSQSASDDRPLARVVFNRDERLDRQPALPPRTIRGLNASAVMPIDTAHQGTWLAATDAGLIYALLNGEARPPAAPRPRPTRLMSRGLIIPSLVDATTLVEVRRRAEQLKWRQFPAFRLLVFEGPRVLDIRPRLDALAIVERTCGERFMATYSSVQSLDAARQRSRFFESVVARPDADLQDIFHRGRWRLCPELGVEMFRPDARTVSRTVVERFADRIEMRYQALDEVGRCVEPVKAVLRAGTANVGAA